MMADGLEETGSTNERRVLFCQRRPRLSRTRQIPKEGRGVDLNTLKAVAKNNEVCRVAH